VAGTRSAADVLGVYGPPLKFDVSLPLAAISGFARKAAELIYAQGGDALPLLFVTSVRGTCTSTSACAARRREKKALYR